MPITITIEAANAQEVRQLVQDLAGTLSGMKNEDIPEDTKVSTLEQAGNHKTAESENIPTVEEIRAKAQALGAEKKVEIKALLDEFGAKNLTSLPENRRAEFLERLEQL